MKNLTIGKRIAAGFAVLLLIMAFLGIFIGWRLHYLESDVTQLSKDTVPSLELLADLRTAAAENRMLVFKHIGSPDQQDMDRLEERIRSNSEEVTRDIETYERMASPEAQTLLGKAKAARADYVRERDAILKLSRTATNAAASAQVYHDARVNLDPLGVAYATAVAQCEQQEKKESDAIAVTALAATRATKIGTGIALLIGLLAGSLLALGIVRGLGKILERVSQALSAGSDEVSAAAQQVSGSSQSLAEGSSEQAASIEETSSSLEELSSMTKRNAQNAERANVLAREARGAAEKGAGDMQDMSSAMGTIKASSDDIAKIIKTIDEIAFQTNILALNAAVEAARAGEAGMGFAVVADEVRNLAQRSAQAAKETAGKIEGAISNTTRGVAISDKVALTLNEIVDKARQVDELAAEVASASREQASGITQINVAVGQMDKVTQSNAASAEECAAASEQLNSQARMMKHSVGELVHLIKSVRPDQHGEQSTPKIPAPAVPAAPTAPAKSFSNNGHRRSPAQNGAAPNRSGIPLDGDFTNF